MFNVVITFEMTFLNCIVLVLVGGMVTTARLEEHQFVTVNTNKYREYDISYHSNV
jgi:hypothetical protein